MLIINLLTAYRLLEISDGESVCYVSLDTGERVFNNCTDDKGLEHDNEGKFTGNGNKTAKNNTEIAKPYKGDDITAEGVSKHIGEYTDLKSLRKNASKYYKNNIQGRYVTREDIGIDKIRFSGSGIDETISVAGSDEEALLLIPSLPGILKTAEYIDFENPGHAERHAETEGFAVFKNKVKVNGKDKPVILLARKEQGYWHYCLFLNKERKKGETE